MSEDKDLIRMFDCLISLEEDAKAISKEIKETLETYATNNEKNKKSIRDLYRKYKEYKRDPEAFVLVDFEVDALLNAIIPEYASHQEVSA